MIEIEIEAVVSGLWAAGMVSLALAPLLEALVQKPVLRSESLTSLARL